MIPVKIFKNTPSFNFIKNAKLAFSGSVILIILSIVLLFTKGLNIGIDFSGGILIEARFKEKSELKYLRNLLENKNLGEVSLQNIGSDKDVMIRIAKDSGSDHSQAQKVAYVKDILKKSYENKIDFRRVDFVGPTIGEELIKSGIYALLLSFIAIMFYIWIRFSYQFGIGAIIALIHDAILTFGFFSLTALEFNLTSIAAILTIIGYSINDSVVIFDRIRENLRRYRSRALSDILNISVNETLSRTVLTAGTTILALLALVIFGGQVLQSFSLAVLFGVVIGTYSSIYIAAPILNRKKTKLI